MFNLGHPDFLSPLFSAESRAILFLKKTFTFKLMAGFGGFFLSLPQERVTLSETGTQIIVQLRFVKR